MEPFPPPSRQDLLTIMSTEHFTHLASVSLGLGTDQPSRPRSTRRPKASRTLARSR